jgi:cyclopropane fatty-acyl-phospholipid synthase-like methyltransferase
LTSAAGATLLDVGGGPGTYSILLTGRFPGLHSEVLELPGVAAVAREIVAAAGAADRVTLRDGDYHTPTSAADATPC